MKYILTLIILLLGFVVNGQNPYFHVPINEIEKTAKKDGYEVSIKTDEVGETINTIYYLTKDNIIIRVGYTSEMLLPSYIVYSKND